MTPAPVADLAVELSGCSWQEDGDVRRPWARASLIFHPPDSPTMYGEPFRLVAPLSRLETDELRWYLERWAIWPSEHLRERAERIETELVDWGRQLWRCLDVEAHRELSQAWRSAPQAGWQRRLTLRIAAEDDHGEADAAGPWLALPWELLHDGEEHLLCAPGGVSIRRRWLPRLDAEPVLSEPASGEPPIRLLLVSPRPVDGRFGYIDHRVSARPLVEALQPLGDLVELEVLEPPTFRTLEKKLELASQVGRPFHVVHFDGHGDFHPSSGGRLVFEHPIDSGELWRRLGVRVTGDKLAKLLQRHRVPVVFLEACRSAHGGERPDASVAAKLLAGGVSSVIAMTHTVLVETTRRFVATFYRELMAGRTVGAAVLAGQRELAVERLRRKTFAGDLELVDWFVPVLFQQRHDPRLVEDARPSGSSIPALQGFPVEPEHCFLGRSRELLALERLLSSAPYAVVRGEGGEGKTELACELARWLVRTNRARRAVFVSLEVDRFPQAVLTTLGSQLVDNFAAEVAKDPEAATRWLERRLADEKTVIVVDNCESVLPPLPGSEDEAVHEPEVLEKILALLERLVASCQTRLIFTSRSPLPAPFADRGDEIELGRLDENSAIELVGRVLALSGMQPEGPEGDEEEDVTALVDAVGRHARSLVLLAAEVASSGVRAATVGLRELMTSLAEKYPDERERSLFASVELSLRRLPVETRERIAPLAVFHGGGHLFVIAWTLNLDLDTDEEIRISKQLISAGLAKELDGLYILFHPALAPFLEDTLNAAQYEHAEKRWADAVTHRISSLYEERNQENRLPAGPLRSELPSLIACLDYVNDNAGATMRVVVASMLEELLRGFGESRALTRVRAVRALAAADLTNWDHARCADELMRIDELREVGEIGEAQIRATILRDELDSLGTSFPSCSFYRAQARFELGRILRSLGQPREALVVLGESRRIFQMVALVDDSTGEAMASQAEEMISRCLSAEGTCLLDLGFLDSAIEKFEKSIELDRLQGHLHSVAAVRTNLGTAYRLQRRLDDALESYRLACDWFQAKGDFANLSITYKMLGGTYQEAARHEEAEVTYLQSLEIERQLCNSKGEAEVLLQLGNLYDAMGFFEESARFSSRAADLFSRVNSVKGEGAARCNLANTLWKLCRLDEARCEIQRSILCDSECDESVAPWKSLDILHDIELAIGNLTAAEEARRRATDAYLVYRLGGGYPQTLGGELSSLVAEAVATGEIEVARGRLSERLEAECLEDPEESAYYDLLGVTFEAILSGDRAAELVENPELDYDDVVELQLLLEQLKEHESRPESATQTAADVSEPWSRH